MDQEINDLLLSELEEAHAFFEMLINHCDKKDIPYSVKDLIIVENNSYRISLDAISKMDDILLRYKELRSNNEDFFEMENKITFKLSLLYLVSIIMITVFAKTLSKDKLNAIWYAMVGLVLGSANMGMIYSNLHDYRYSTENNRKIMNELMSLREEYDNNFEISRREISYMFSLNRNLDTNEINDKKLTKIIKGMQ